MHTTSQTDYIVVKISSNDVVNNDALGNYYTHKFQFIFYSLQLRIQCQLNNSFFIFQSA